MVTHSQPVRYRIRHSHDGKIRLTVYDPKADPLKEETLLEGYEFDSVADVLHYIANHYTSAQEIEDGD